MTAAALDGVTVLDVSTLFAGPLAATLLGDLGADVLKIEHPEHGDPLRGHGHATEGISLWWKAMSRNKRTLALLLSDPRGRAILLRLAAEADVLIENFRPGTLERWGMGPEQLHEVNPGLVILRVTGFGQTGPLAHRPGFGTLAEALSGFAHSTGEPDGPPTLPPFGLADGIAAVTGAYATLAALRHRDRTGEGQVIDMSIVEPILMVLGPQVTVYERLGIVQQRTGNRSVNNAPRNTYRTRDGRWIAVSTSAQSIAERVMRLVGRPDLIAQPWFGDGRGRAQNVEVLDEAVAAWVGARDLEEVLAGFDAVDAAAAPVQDAADLAVDPQLAALDAFVWVDDPEVGPLRLQNVPFRMSRTPGRIAFAGRPRGADTDELLSALGYDDAARSALRAAGVV